MNPVVRDLRYRCEYALFRVVAALFSALPVEMASLCGGALWRLVAPLTHRHARARRQLAAAFPEMPPDEIDSVARAMWEGLGRAFGEFFHLDEIRRTRLTIENPAILRGDGSGPAGFVAAGAHMANWEVAAASVSRDFDQLASIYQRIKNPFVDGYVLRRRAAIYPAGLFEKGPATARKLIRHLRGGGCVGLLADLRDNQGVRVPFFGTPAPSSTFPAMMARVVEVPLYFVCLVRESGVRFHVRFEPVEVPRTDDREADIARATANLHAVIEANIRRHPEQWMWAHRRWG